MSVKAEFSKSSLTLTLRTFQIFENGFELILKGIYQNKNNFLKIMFQSGDMAGDVLLYFEAYEWCIKSDKGNLSNLACFKAYL